MTEARHTQRIEAKLQEQTQMVTQQADRLRQQEAQISTKQTVYDPSGA